MAIDKYANIATIQVTMSALNVLTFQELTTQLGVLPRRTGAMAMLLDQVDYLPGAAAIGEMATAADTIQMALTISNAVPDLTDILDRRILSFASLLRTDLGVAASGVIIKLPITEQFFPPLITAEKSLFLGMSSGGLANPGVLRCRIYYRLVEISKDEMIELLEVFRLVG